MKKNVKGITLVSMVITIIVMLILAGVSISMVTGDNGVVTRASEGSIDTRVASIESDLSLAISSLQTDYMTEKVEDASLAASKNSFFSVGKVGDGKKGSGKPYKTNHPGINDYLAESQIVHDESAADDAVGTAAKTNDSGDYKVKAYKNATSMSKILTGATVSAPKAIFLTNGADGTKIDNDLYIAAMYMEDGVPRLVDIGLVQVPNGTYTQGTAVSTITSDDKTEIVWLKGEI